MVLSQNFYLIIAGNFDYHHLDNSHQHYHQNNTRHSHSTFANHSGAFEADNSAASNSMGRPSSAASMTAGPRTINTNCLGQEQFSIDQQQPFVTAGSTGAVASNAAGGPDAGSNSGGGLNDLSFDNLDEIVAIAIKAEFHSLDLVEMTNRYEAALKKYDQFARNTSCFWGNTGSNITPVVQFQEFFARKIMNKLIHYYC